jgi:Prolyl oligopeptidase family
MTVPRYSRAVFLLGICLVQIFLSGAVQSSQNTVPVVDLGRRPATVLDSIAMTRLADPNYTAGGSSRGVVAQFSPDGKRFIVLVRKGNVERNTNEYSLLLFRTAEAFHSPSPRVLMTMSSSSNREAIKQPRWLADNDTILFLGENPHELRQLYSLQCSSMKVKKLTHRSTSILSYAANATGDHIVILAEKATTLLLTDQARRQGIVISHQVLPDLIAGIEPGRYDDCDLFVKTKASGEFAHVDIEGNLPPTHPLYLSPNGRYLVVLPIVSAIPENWKAYEEDLLQRLLKAGSVLSYELVDTEERTSRPLVDAPPSPTGPYEAAWLPDSQSIIISGIYLPWNIPDPVESKARRYNSFAAEIKVPSRQVLPIAMRNDLKQPTYDAKNGNLTFEFGNLVEGEPSKVAYRRRAGHWEEQRPEPQSAKLNSDLEIRVVEDSNTPPKIVVVNLADHERSILLDLNPQFRYLRFAEVERITWKATDAHQVEGGLYRPPDFVPGKKYPLVIQTHGFNPDKFLMEGPYATAFAAQALANKGMLVVQANEGGSDSGEADKYVVSPKENPREMASYEGLIDYLDAQGLIDRSRVGIVGFSRTCMHVKYALTHSKYKFAAVSLTDGIDAGYVQYLAFSNADQETASEFEQINDGPPFGKGLTRWFDLVPGFRLDTVTVPVLLQAIGPASLLGEWEWFSGLLRLGKPVELIYIPDGTHLLEKPWERITSQQGNVDWFCFWLQNKEDPDPAKVAQYERWRALRAQFAESQKKQSTQ